MKEYDTDTKDKVISDFSSGTGIMELSRKHDVPKSTVQGWIKKATHQHHWLVESPNGPLSKGKCMTCKKEKYFNNAIELEGWPKFQISKPKSKWKKNH